MKGTATSDDVVADEVGPGISGRKEDAAAPSVSPEKEDVAHHECPTSVPSVTTQDFGQALHEIPGLTVPTFLQGPSSLTACSEAEGLFSIRSDQFEDQSSGTTPAVYEGVKDEAGPTVSPHAKDIAAPCVPPDKRDVAIPGVSPEKEDVAILSVSPHQESIDTRGPDGRRGISSVGKSANRLAKVLRKVPAARRDLKTALRNRRAEHRARKGLEKQTSQPADGISSPPAATSKARDGLTPEADDIPPSSVLSTGNTFDSEDSDGTEGQESSTDSHDSEDREIRGGLRSQRESLATTRDSGESLLRLLDVPGVLDAPTSPSSSGSKVFLFHSGICTLGMPPLDEDVEDEEGPGRSPAVDDVEKRRVSRRKEEDGAVPRTDPWQAVSRPGKGLGRLAKPFKTGRVTKYRVLAKAAAARKAHGSEAPKPVSPCPIVSPPASSEAAAMSNSVELDGSVGRESPLSTLGTFDNGSRESAGSPEISEGQGSFVEAIEVESAVVFDNLSSVDLASEKYADTLAAPSSGTKLSKTAESPAAPDLASTGQRSAPPLPPPPPALSREARGASQVSPKVEGGIVRVLKQIREIKQQLRLLGHRAPQWDRFRTAGELRLPRCKRFRKTRYWQRRWKHFRSIRCERTPGPGFAPFRCVVPEFPSGSSGRVSYFSDTWSSEESEVV